MKNYEIINLTSVRENEKVYVSEILGGSGVKQKLNSLGIFPGRQVIKKTSRNSKGPVLIEVMNSELAIGRQMAGKIMVRAKKKNLILTGNPNVGKSVVFSRLTGLDVISSNYPGTTIEYMSGNTILGKERFCVTDVPGSYSLSPNNPAEQVATKLMDESEPDLIINVIDSTNLERNLFFALQILEKNIPAIFLMNKWDIARRKGIDINISSLSEKLGVRLIPFVATTGEGLKELNEAVSDYLKRNLPKPEEIPKEPEEKWKLIGKLTGELQTISHKHPSFLEKLADITTKPTTGIPFAIVLLFITFYFIRFLGESLINYVMDPLFNNFYLPFIKNFVSKLDCELCSDLLIGSTGEVMKSFGLLTTGLYIPLAVVLPYIFSFYLVLSFLEDLGYLPRLSVLLDNVMHKLGLHGYGTIPMMLGLGCKVPAIFATRILETKRERIIAAVLALQIAPCMPQTAMIFSLLGRYGLKYMILTFLTIALVGIIAGTLLNKAMKGETPELFVEIPGYQIPSIKVLMTKLWIRIRSFLFEAVPMIMLGVFIMNVLDLSGALNKISEISKPFVVSLLGLPSETVSVITLGFLRKDISIAMLAPFNLMPHQIVVASVFLTLYLPCMASFFVLLKELGLKDLLKIIFLNFLLAFLISSILNLILIM